MLDRSTARPDWLRHSVPQACQGMDRPGRYIPQPSKALERVGYDTLLAGALDVTRQDTQGVGAAIAGDRHQVV
jgi:hypothetical protein